MITVTSDRALEIHRTATRSDLPQIVEIYNSTHRSAHRQLIRGAAVLYSII